MPDAFDKIKTSISKNFDPDDPTIAITSAIIRNTRRPDGPSTLSRQRRVDLRDGLSPSPASTGSRG